MQRGIEYVEVSGVPMYEKKWEMDCKKGKMYFFQRWQEGFELTH